MKKKATVKPLGAYDAGRPSPYHQNPPPSASPNYEWAVSGRTLRDWARDLADNSSVAAAILSSREANGVGTGLTYEPLVKRRDGTLAEALNDTLRRRHEEWSRSCDVTGELSRHELECLLWRGWDMDGESFARFVIRPEGYRLQIIPPEWIGYWDSDIGSSRIIHGVEKDEWGKPIAYYVYPMDPAGGIYSGMTVGDALRIPASDIWHLKRIKSANQTRGVTLLHAVIFRIADVAEYQQSHRLAARASVDMFASINRGPDFQIEGEDGDGQYQSDRQWMFDRLQIMDGLLPGETVNFHDPKNPNQNAVEFVQQELRTIAAATDSGFSQIAQVFDASYAAQRLEVVDTWRKVDRDRRRFINTVARDALYQQVIRYAILTGQVSQRALRGIDQSTLLDVRIDGPVMPVIDPLKDRQGLNLDQENQWDSRRGIIRRLGRDPSAVDAEIESDDSSVYDTGAPNNEQ